MYINIHACILIQNYIVRMCVHEIIIKILLHLYIDVITYTN